MGSLLKRLLKHERGNVLAMVAAMMPLLIGAAALGVDTIQLALWKRQLQRAADTAALAGAHAVSQGKPYDQAVLRSLELNNQVPLSAPPAMWNAPVTGAFVGNPSAVEVVLSLSRPVPFLSFFTGTTPTMSARAVASRTFTGEHCLLGLEKSKPDAIGLGGDAVLDLGCGIAANSTAVDSVRLHGNLRLTVSGVHSAGDIYLANSVNYPSEKLHPHSSTQIDPFGSQARNLQIPPITGGCDQTKFKVDGGSHTITPGRYCDGIEITGTSNVTFEPGTYVIDEGDFKINGDTFAQGGDVTFILKGSARIEWNGNSVIAFDSPNPGSGSPFQGILVFQDPLAPDKGNKINGESRLTLEGAFYMPSQLFEWAGNTIGTTECLQIVAREIQMSGYAQIKNSCSRGYGDSDTKIVRLVE